MKFEERKLALQPKQKENKRIFPFVTTYQPSVPNLKQILMKRWYVIGQQPLLSEIYRDPPLISYEKGRSLKDILMKKAKTRAWESCRPIAFYIIEVDLSLVFHLIFCISL